MRVSAYTIIFFLLSLLSQGGSAAQCGRNAGDALCPNRQCCSALGFCGTSAFHCDPRLGCQSQCAGSGGEQCGWQNLGALCPGGLCCSNWGFCGTGDAWCGGGCQSQCDAEGVVVRGGHGYLSDVIPESLFEEMLPYRNDPRCDAKGFYTYNAFISAAKEFPEFGTTGDNETRKREIAAFFGQTSQETTGGRGWDAPQGPYYWGYCHKREKNCAPYCLPSSMHPCVSGKLYCGRGPIQLKWNYYYAQSGDALNLSLAVQPELVETDPVISFKTAIWFWMTAQPSKPSCHDVITGKWTPTKGDIEAGRVPGYGVITNIINGGFGCGSKLVGDFRSDANNDRIGFYKRYCGLLGIDPGNNLDCYDQRPFGGGLLNLKDSI